MVSDTIKLILDSHIIHTERSQDFYKFLERSDSSDYEFLIQFSGAPRKLGRHLLTYTPQEEHFLKSLTPSLYKLTAGNLGRVLLALKRKKKSVLHEILLRGDDFEKACILMTLPFRDDAVDFHFDAVNACRTNSLDTYKAIAIDNPYPSRFFSDSEFNQMVLKVTFLDLAFERIYGLEQRYNSDLGRSLRFLYDERVSAGRTLPNTCLVFMQKKKLI